MRELPRKRMSIRGVARICLMINLGTESILMARKTLKATITPRAQARETKKCLVVMEYSKIDVDEFRRLSAENHDRAGQNAPPEAPPISVDRKLETGRRCVNFPAEVFKQMFDPFHKG